MTQSRIRVSRSAAKGRFAQAAEDTAARERTIQAKIDEKDASAKHDGGKKPMQAGTREYPAPAPGPWPRSLRGFADERHDEPFVAPVMAG